MNTNHEDTKKESHPVASCIRCGETLKGVMALTATLCGLCADDELNERARETQQLSE